MGLGLLPADFMPIAFPDRGVFSAVGAPFRRGDNSIRRVGHVDRAIAGSTRFPGDLQQQPGLDIFARG